MPTPANTSRYFPIEPRRSRLLAQCWTAQNTDRFISPDTIARLAREHGLSNVEISGIASFYHFFHDKPAGEHTIYLDNSIIAEFNGFENIKAAFERETGATLGGVDPSGQFGLFSTPCIGLSDHAPAALVDFYPVINLTPEKVAHIVNALKNGIPAAEIADTPDDHIIGLPANDRSILFAPWQRGQAVTELSRHTPGALLSLLEKNALKGRGGAFYPAWLKWEACRKQAASAKFIICNADEGEPGTFKDRVLLNNQTGPVLEGMILAAYTVGARYGIIYLRGEYQWLSNKIQQEIDDFHAQGLLGVNAGGIEGFDFDIRIETGAGAYICGEETALLESLEGKRGEVRTKWYFPVERGYLQLPTVVNNVETFAAAARMIAMGPEAYATRGVPGSPGTKLISISGDCRFPGIYEIEWGTRLSELLERCGAEDPFMIQVSGPSGTSLSAADLQRPIAMPGSGIPDAVACGGSLMVFNSKRDLLRILLNFAEFFKHESCGVCTPCRAGNFILQRQLSRLLKGAGDRSDLANLAEWARIMETASRCGLGKSAGNALIQTVERFADWYATRLPGPSTEGMHPFDLQAAEADYEKFKPSAP